MDVKAIRVVRRALETIIAYDTEYKCDLITHEPDYDHPIDGSCGLIARRALMALSTIDPEAIRSDARAEALREASEAISMMNQMSPTAIGDDYLVGYGSGVRECQVKLESIIAHEPEERDGGLRWHCKHCASEFNDSFMEYYCDDDAGEGDYVGECPVCGSRNLITACSKLKEAER